MIIERGVYKSGIRPIIAGKNRRNFLSVATTGVAGDRSKVTFGRPGIVPSKDPSVNNFEIVGILSIASCLGPSCEWSNPLVAVTCFMPNARVIPNIEAFQSGVSPSGGGGPDGPPPAIETPPPAVQNWWVWPCHQICPMLRILINCKIFA